MPRTRRSIRTINVRELIEELQEQDPEALVVFAADYGDIGHTQQALAIVGDIEECVLRESAYSASGWAISLEQDDDDEQEGTSEETVPILVIK
jgi:hypothetical protein